MRTSCAKRSAVDSAGPNTTVEQAVFLGERVIVLGSHPGRLVADLPVPLGRDRDLGTKRRPEFLELRAQVEDLVRAFHSGDRDRDRVGDGRLRRPDPGAATSMRAMSAVAAETIDLGDITCPSGQLVIIDAGYLNMWSGERSPATLDPEAVYPDGGAEAQDVVGDGIDFEIVGPDATAAARTFRQSGHWVYDVPGRQGAAIRESFRQHCAPRSWDAELVATARVAHRDRVRRAVEAGGQDFVMFGVPVAAIGGLPADRPLAVQGSSRDYGQRIGRRWEHIRISTGTGDVARTTTVGVVGVDWARVLFGDADALGAWQHEESLDGLADFVFWGRDAREAAEFHQASPVDTPGEGSTFGWVDQPLAEAVQHGLSMEDWLRADPTRRLAVDFRPHSHHWQVMRLVRASPHEVGTIEVGGAHVLCAMTKWGDGIFDVYADFDADGTLLAVRLVLDDGERPGQAAAALLT